jgi:tetratricopeptide (TPR) repeat protein
MWRSLLLLTSWLAAPALAADPPAARPDDVRRDALARYGAGLLHARGERLVQAAKQQQAAADKDPTAAAPLRELAKLYAELGRDPAAIRSAQKAVALDPSDFVTARLLGKLLSDARQPAAAVKAYRLAADSPSLTDPVTKLSVLTELGKTADAVDPKAAEAARRDALRLIADAKLKLLQPDLFTPTELERERVKLYEALGHALVKQAQFAPASAAFRTARDLAADPKAANDPSGVARLHWNMSAALTAQTDLAEALTELEKYLSFNPVAFEPYERLVELYRKLNRQGELPATLERLARANPKNLAPRWLLADDALRTDPSTADTLFRKLIGTATSADQFRTLVAAYRQAGRPKELLDHLDRVYRAARPEGFDDPDRDPKKDTPPPPADAVERARLFTAAVKAVPPKLGFTAQLLEQLADETRGGPARTPDTLELLGGLAVRDQQVAAFIEPLWQTARRKSDLRVTWLLLTHLSQQRRWEDLARAAKELKVVSKNGAQFIYFGIAAQAAIANAELGNERAALDALKDAGTGFYADQQRVRVYNLLGKHADALAVCERVLANDRPAGADLRGLQLVQADTLNYLKRHADAEAVMRRLLDDDPDDVLVLNNLGYNLADQGRKLDEAETLIRRAIELDRFERTKNGDPEPVSGGYTDSLGWAVFRRGKLTEARELLEKAAASPESAPDPIVWDHLGDVAFRQGDKTRAAAAWAKATELYANTHQGRESGRLDEVKRKRKLVQ